MPHPRVPGGLRSQNWLLLHLPGVCENRLQMGKPCPNFIQLENIIELKSFKCVKKKKKATHKIQLVGLSPTETGQERGGSLPPHRWFWFRKCAWKFSAYNYRDFVLLLRKVKLLLNVSELIGVYISSFFSPTFAYLGILIISPSARSISTCCGKLVSPHDPKEVGSSSDNTN